MDFKLRAISSLSLFAQQVKRKLLDSLVRPFTFLLLRHFPLRNRIDSIFQWMRTNENIFPTFDIRDLKPVDNPFSKRIFLNPHLKLDTGIIVQGPIDKKQDFTYFTINRYLENFSDAVIVLSTWDDEDTTRFDEIACRQSRFKVVTQRKPDLAGISNINYQIASTNAGIAKVNELQLDYCAKTRTDQCLFDPFSLMNLKSMLRHHSTNVGNQKIVTLSLNTFLLRLYGPSDMFQFGTTERLTSYWNTPMDVRNLQEISFTVVGESLREFAKRELCEVYLGVSYLRREGKVLDFTLRQSLEMYRDYFVVADVSYVDLIWNKYTLNGNRWRHPTFPSPNHEMTYGHWLSLVDNIDYFSNLDYLLDSSTSQRDFV